eukprot:TRINITY_DN5851_c1_g4_i1.p1 TRINITY_DN5851_c1_g4~~TRINITY_DN5851_c1_g4_i1.p1  ORF type:complete len:504 (+),score=42.40 TRINITY_DN5851_c1_g4_i1:87-1598(+)
MGCSSSIPQFDANKTVWDPLNTAIVIVQGGHLVRVNNYIIVETIGIGSTSVVYLAVKGSVKYAIKEIPKKDGIHEHEISVMKALSHPNIIRFYEVVESPNHNMAYIIQEYLSGGQVCGVSPSGHLLEACMPGPVIKNIFTQIMEAVLYLHSENIVHGDLKLENILWTDSTKRHLKIIDFGSAKRFDSNEDLDSAARADVSAIGVCMYLLLTGSYPGKASTCMEVVNQFQNGDPSEILECGLPNVPQLITNKMTLREFSKCRLPQWSICSSDSGSFAPIFRSLHSNLSSSKLETHSHGRRTIGRPFTVLVCEPNHISRKTAIVQLRHIGSIGKQPLHISSCRSADVVIQEVLKGNTFDLIMLSSKRGLPEVFTRLRSMNYGLPILGMASRSELSSSSLQSTYPPGLDFIQKPLCQSELLSHVMKSGFEISETQTGLLLDDSYQRLVSDDTSQESDASPSLEYRRWGSPRSCNFGLREGDLSPSFGIPSFRSKRGTDDECNTDSK